MSTRLQPEFSLWRFTVAIVLVMIFMGSLTARIIILSIYDQKFLQHQGNVRVLRTIDQPAFRGMITDRNNLPLAISTAVFSVMINSKLFIIDDKQSQKFATLLSMTVPQLTAILKVAHDKKHVFFALAKNITPVVADEIRKVAMPGVSLLEQEKRFYPEGEVVSQIIGFTGIDDHGQEGMELIFDKWLSGQDGKKLTIKDRIGRDIVDVKTLQTVEKGNDLTLSIDKRIQYLAYRELINGVQMVGAASGSVVVLNAKTGEILAMVNAPSFNPNNNRDKHNHANKNFAITDTFEPGSTIKAFSVAAALETGKFTPESVIDTSPGWLRVGKNLVRDEHSKGPMTITHILEISSNVGITKMILSLPNNHLWELLHHVGFGEVSGIGFPGEQSGKIIDEAHLKPFAMATLAFGYGLSVSTLQLADAYSIFANDGIKLPLSLLKISTVPEGKRVLTAAVANKMLTVLEAVTTSKSGTGRKAKIPGFRVAGKTGTSLTAGIHGYQKKIYTSSFVGIAPVSKPVLIVAVVLHNPSGKKHMGGDVSAPIFKQVMEGALRVLNTEPDDLEGSV